MRSVERVDLKRTGRRVVPGLVVILLGLVVVGATTTFSCSEASCGPTTAPLAVLFAFAAVVVGGALLFRRRRR